MKDTKKILVVDDSENIRYLIRTILEIKGYDIVLASNGKRGIAKAKKEKPSLIILDIMMPDMDGWDVLKRLQKESIKVPVIILTGRADDLSKKVSEKVYKVSGYLTKPFLQEDLMDAVEKALK